MALRCTDLRESISTRQFGYLDIEKNNSSIVRTIASNIEHSYSEGAYYAIQEKTGIRVTRTMDIENGYGKLTDDEY